MLLSCEEVWLTASVTARFLIQSASGVFTVVLPPFSTLITDTPRCIPAVCETLGRLPDMFCVNVLRRFWLLMTLPPPPAPPQNNRPVWPPQSLSVPVNTSSPPPPPHKWVGTSSRFLFLSRGNPSSLSSQSCNQRRATLKNSDSLGNSTMVLGRSCHSAWPIYTKISVTSTLLVIG